MSTNLFSSSITSSSSSSTKTKTKARNSHFKPSSGQDKARRHKRTIRLLQKKIARWERNQANPQKVAAGKSRNNWNTSGMKSHLALLEGK